MRNSFSFLFCLSILLFSACDKNGCDLPDTENFFDGSLDGQCFVIDDDLAVLERGRVNNDSCTFEGSAQQLVYPDEQLGGVGAFLLSFSNIDLNQLSCEVNRTNFDQVIQTGRGQYAFARDSVWTASPTIDIRLGKGGQTTSFSRHGPQASDSFFEISSTELISSTSNNLQMRVEGSFKCLLYNEDSDQSIPAEGRFSLLMAFPG